ncbi:MAG TPA: S46 family peptidase, partial [Bacteroidales bacterium]|nr:S46 family peptidase [Bacteroidales bacterium]
MKLQDGILGKLRTLLLFMCLVPCLATRSEEGMWIPMLLEKINIRQMQDLGLRLSAEDIYSINHSSLKDAVCQFGGGCTAGIVSPDGLILTNHHCGYGSIQRHSTLGHDYLTDGFWAKDRGEELPNPGLTVTLMVRMEDVTQSVLKGVNGQMNALQRSLLIKMNSDSIEKSATRGTKFEAKVRAFFYGNQYYLIITSTYKDIRLVGAPPSAIGQFGGDTDNWMWPRYGADFSIFRIYAGSGNEPAEFSKDNIPYHPRSYLKISLKGYLRGDFTFVLGYPGTTREYLTSSGVRLIAFTENPVKIRLRRERLDVFDRAMQADRLTRIQYASKHAGIANGWKKMIGETRGIARIDGVKRKEEFENKFQAWADSVAKGDGRFTGLLKEFRKAYEDFLPVDLASVYLQEGGMGIEIVRFASGFRELCRISKSDTTRPAVIRKTADNLKKSARTFFHDYRPAIDREVMDRMLEEMKRNMDPKYLPDIFGAMKWDHDGEPPPYGPQVFGRTILADSTRLFTFLDHYRKKEWRKLENDPAYRLSLSIYTRYENDIQPAVTRFTMRIDSLQRIYVLGQMLMREGENLYPDANSTLRVSYGRVEGYRPADAVEYNYFTTSTG